MREELTVASADDMLALGRRLAAVLLPGDLVVLSGDLGAGKTTLVQGIGAGLGVRGPITSPTFVIARVHPSLTGGPGPGARRRLPAHQPGRGGRPGSRRQPGDVGDRGRVGRGTGRGSRRRPPGRQHRPGRPSHPRPRAGRRARRGRAGYTGRIRSHGRCGWRATAPGGKAPTASRPPGDPFAGAGMRVWPTTVGRRLYSSSVLTLTVRASLPRLVGPLAGGRPGLGRAVMHGSIPSRRRTVVQQGPPPPRSGRVPPGRPRREWSDGDYADEARSTRHGRYPEWSRAGRTTTNVSAAGPGTGRAAPPGRRAPGGRPAAGHRTGTPHRVGAGAAPAGGPRPARGGAAGPRTSGAAPSSPCCSSSPGWVTSTSTAPALSRRRNPWSPRSSRVSSRPCRTPARR